MTIIFSWNISSTIEGNGSSKYTNFVAPIVASVVFLIVMIGVGAYLIQKCKYILHVLMLINSLEIKQCEHGVILRYILIRNSKDVIVNAYTIQKNFEPFQKFEKKLKGTI